MERKTISQQDLIDFEIDIFNNYSQGKIKAPVHLTGSVDGKQEDALIEIFKKIKKNDWVFSTHRSHYHAILKSQDMKWVKSEILAKRSININSKKYKIFTSAIVGGNLPIALGVAMALKKKQSKDKVYCFTGDMAATMGIFNECQKYAAFNKLPITFIIEDNGIGCYTPTHKAWNGIPIINLCEEPTFIEKNVLYYKYERKYPHYGTGSWVTF